MSSSRWIKKLVVNTAYLAKGWRVGTVRGRILTYHRVDEVKGDRLVVTPDAFRAQMNFLRRQGIRVVDLATLIDSLKYPNKSADQVAVSFDDGYLDNYQFAWPILRTYRYPATVFVPPALIGREEPLPTQRRGASLARLMSWGQLEDLVKDGVTVGSHSLTHARLTRMPLQQARVEVLESKRLLENKLRLAVDWFSYPSGAYSAEVVHLVQRAGYHGALSVRPGANTPKTHRFVLRRTEVSGEDTLSDFEKKLAGAFDGWHQAVQTFQRWQRKVRR